MNSKHLTAAAAAFFITVSGASIADEIYKWVDADGNIHYEDRPSGNPTEERLNVAFQRTNSSAVQDRVSARLESQAERDKARQEKDKEKQSAAEKAAEAEERKKRCADYRSKLETMVQSRRLYREGADGEREYLDEAARAEARNRAENLVKETCN